MNIKIEFKLLVMFCVTAFLSNLGTVSAGTFSMGEVKSQYRQETGKDWEEATVDEKKEYLNILETRKETNSTHYEKEGRLQELKDMSTQKERTPYDVRKSFENEMGISWENATEEQRLKFQRDYDLLMKENKREERDHARTIRNEGNEVRSEELMEKRENRREEKIKIRERKAELAEDHRKRREERQKIRNAKEKRNALLREIKDKIEGKK